MTTHNFKALYLNNEINSNNNDEEYSIPLDISDIISICREYNKLGHQIQNQVENILEVGVEESIKNNSVKKESLPFIKNFLQLITKNVYFGEAVLQANLCVKLIDEYNLKNIVIPIAYN